MKTALALCLNHFFFLRLPQNGLPISFVGQRKLDSMIYMNADNDLKRDVLNLNQSA